MSQEIINKSLQKTLISPLTHDLLWSQFLTAFSYELENMREEYSLIKDNWNVNKNDKSDLVRISESFGYTPNLMINNTINLAKREIDSIPYRIREKTTYNGYSLIFKQNGSLGNTFNYYWNGYKLVKAVNYEDTVNKLIQSNHYTPFYDIEPILNYQSVLNSNNIMLDYLVNNKKVYDEYSIRYYSLDQKFNPFWKLDTSYIKIPTKHLGIEYFPQTYYCTYSTSLGVGYENESIYECNIQQVKNYINKSMIIKIDNVILETTITVSDNKEYFIDENGVLNENSYFDISDNLVHLEFNIIPTDCEISITYNIDLLMTSDYFYYLEKGMNYNKRCPIIPHSGIFLSVDIAQSRGSDFYYPNENHYTIPDLKIKAITASSYNRYITLTEPSKLDNAMDEQGQPSGEDNYRLDSLIKWFLDSATSETQSMLNNFKYIAVGNQALNIISEQYNQIFNQKFVIFYYNLNSDDDSSEIYDTSSNQLNCDVSGDTVKIDSIINKSLNFNGETYANSTSQLTINSGENYTFGIWFKATNIISNDRTLFDSFIKISYDYNNQKIIIDSNSYDCSIDEYHFLCLLFKSTDNSVDVYIDNQLIDTFNFTIASTSSTIYIGTDSTTTDNFYGEIDDLWLLSKIITSDQMNYLYTKKISIISHMGNRLAYYELTDDEKYEDDTYVLIQSYVKAMDINHENTSLCNSNSESEYFTYNTKFYPIIPAYFTINYTNSLGKDIIIYSNEKGEFYSKDKDNLKNVTGSIDFEKGSWQLAKNTIESVSQEIIKSPTKTIYPYLYNVVEENGDSKWYTDKEHTHQIYADEYPSNYTTYESFIETNQDDDDLSTNVYTRDKESYYILSSTNTPIYIKSYTINTDNEETPLFSSDDGKSLYLALTDVRDETNQIKMYVDLGESSSTRLYSKDGGATMYLDVKCSVNNQIRKWKYSIGTSIYFCYTLGDTSGDVTYYSDLSFTTIVTTSNTIADASFNPYSLVIKCTQIDLNLSPINTEYYYHDNDDPNGIYTIDYIKSFNEYVDKYDKVLVKNSITFNYWVNNIKLTATVNEEGAVSGEYISSSQFNYENNSLNVTFEDEINSDVIISYEYQDSLDIDCSKPVTMNYKTEKSNCINEVGLEDENHELMAYMTFPNIEFNSIDNNLSVLFAIAKS